ncbi:hypothetical protein BIFDEN_01983 [Bifidobacterium dentium ATCC 27678]|nr:hypothetical protein BIFDEN_01983 [Bifidobacterium dentium ATCC 27678]
MMRGLSLRLRLSGSSESDGWTPAKSASDGLAATARRTCDDARAYDRAG